MSLPAITDDYTIAKQRWKLLAQMLVKRNCNVKDSTVSGRRFASFGLLKTEKVTEKSSENVHQECIEKEKSLLQDKRHRWYTYKCIYNTVCYNAKLRHLDGSINVEDLLGFNNTGNVCVWPSEEILTYFCIQNMELFNGKKICELGGGMTCLAGVFVALHSEVEEILLTDGNEQSIENVEVIVNENKEQFGKSFVHARVLRWNESQTFSDLKNHFDTVICADCLFFDEYRQDLVNLLDLILSAQGEAIIFAPKRGHTFKEFKDLAENVFTVTTTENYDQHVWNLHIQNKTNQEGVYKEDTHYPLMLRLKKKCQQA